MVVGLFLARKPFSFLTPAYGAALALVAIQVGIGILYKVAQSGGKYTFSASASITISEFLKFLLSTIFFYRELNKRAGAGEPWGQRGSSQYTFPPLLQLWLEEVPQDIKYGFAQLALLYAMINNSIFLLYQLADPGTINLIKSGITLITALVLYFALNAKINNIQWVSIVLQVCGVVVVQYHPEAGSTYPLSTYLVLLFQTSISAVSGVYNQHLLKSSGASLHANNMVLYASGVCLNLLVYTVMRMIKSDEPGFFTGYGNIGAVLVVMSNVLIGLVITAVYKYADAVIKCFATAISTAILLYISPIISSVKFSALVFPGTTVVFLATWLYMGAANPNRTTETADPPTPVPYDGTKSSIWLFITALSPQGRLRNVGLSATSALSIFVIAILTLWDTHLSVATAFNPHKEPTPIYLQSPFKDTLAYIRWNSDSHPERMPITRSYQPFFHTLHFSMPNYVSEQPHDFNNLTHDSWQESTLGYKAIAQTMDLVLKTTDEIEGLLFFHFDAWVDPLGFQDMDRQKIWYPDSPNPRYMCINDTKFYNEWWGWNGGIHEHSMAASKAVSGLEMNYVVDVNEWCIGWSDLYYIPRQYFSDFITLAEVFAGLNVFHEVAIPTILHIIDETRQSHPTRSIIERLGDCWGDCCASNPTVVDILWKRCGHRLDFTAEDVFNVHFKRLGEEALMLGLDVQGKAEK